MMGNLATATALTLTTAVLCISTNGLVENRPYQY